MFSAIMRTRQTGVQIAYPKPRRSSITCAYPDNPGELL
jgi:hypothetical protein